MPLPWLLILADDLTPGEVIRRQLHDWSNDRSVLAQPSSIECDRQFVDVLITGSRNLEALDGEFSSLGLRVRAINPIAGVGPCHKFMLTNSRPLGIFDALATNMSFKRRLAKNAIFYVAAGGCYRTYIPASASPEYINDSGPDSAQTILDSYETTYAGNSGENKEASGIGAAIHSLTADPQGVSVRCRGEFSFKLRDKDAEASLENAVGGAWGRSVDFQPATSWKVNIAATSNMHQERFVKEFTMPELYTRIVNGAHCQFGQVVAKSGFILPESFRHPYTRRLRNRNVKDVSQDFVSVPRVSATRKITRPLFYLDTEYPDHFGHVMTEVMGRIASYKAAVRNEPRLGVLISTKGKDGLPAWAAELFRLSGIAPDRIELVRQGECVVVDELWTSTPMWSQPRWIHRGLAELWHEIRSNSGATVGGGRPLFSSRAVDAVRTCSRHESVEELFQSHGFCLEGPSGSERVTKW